MKFVNIIFPPNTTRRTLAGRVARKLKLLNRHPDIHYAEWVERTEPFTWSEVRELKYQPLISIVVPVFNSPAKYLLPMVYSVVNQQSYENWELVLVNASSSTASNKLTTSCGKIDSRIRVINLTENKGIAGNTNAGIDGSLGKYIALLDHDDLLAPQALYEVGLSLQKEPRPQLIYTDEDKISEEGEYRFDPFFKPGWSPYMFRHVNYLNHLAVIEKKVIKRVRGYRDKFEGAQDFDLFLRLIDSKPVIEHIPKILYHWRTAIGSTAHDFESKKNIVDAGILALEDHLKRNKQEGKVSHLEKQPGFYSISYRTRAKDSLAVFILPSSISSQYSSLIDRLTQGLEVSLDTEIFIYGPGRDANRASGNIKIQKVDEVNKEKFIIKALNKTDANLLIFVNSGVGPLKKDWAELLAGLISQAHNIGVATPVLIDALKKIVDAGYIYGGERDVPLLQNLPVKANTYLGNTIWGRNIDRASNRVVAMRREIYDKYFKGQDLEVGGNISSYQEILKGGLEVVLCMDTPMNFYGDLEASQHKSHYFNQNLVDLRRGVSLPKTINVPPEDLR